MKLIVALDFNQTSHALSLVEKLDPSLCALKVGLEMYTRFGAAFVKQLVDRQYRVFLDLKFHDIPNTVSAACKAAADLGVWMINVHALGGLKMMQSAKEIIDTYGSTRPLLIGVTILTSMLEKEMFDVGLAQSLQTQVNQLAALAQQAGLDGVVCSAHEVASLKALCGTSFLTITPGIRLTEDSSDDQARIVTPQQAICAGSDFLVMGRSITKASDPLAKLSTILQMIS